jgi:hypothetical protein
MILSQADFRFLQSHVKNPVIFEAFTKAHYIESAGKSTPVYELELQGPDIDLIINDLAPLIDMSDGQEIPPLAQRADSLITLLNEAR